MRARFVLLAVTMLGLGGCSVHSTGVQTLGPPPQEQYTNWPAPAHGIYLCLVAPEGLPIYSHPHDGLPIMGYTRSLVAFKGLQDGRWLAIQTYAGFTGWIDGTRLQPFGNVHPGQECVVMSDYRQRPVFYVH